MKKKLISFITAVIMSAASVSAFAAEGSEYITKNLTALTVHYN